MLHVPESIYHWLHRPRRALRGVTTVQPLGFGSVPFNVKLPAARMWRSPLLPRTVEFLFWVPAKGNSV